MPLIVGDAADWRASERALERGRVRAGDPAADGARGHLAAAAGRDGVAHQLRAARGRRSWRRRSTARRSSGGDAPGAGLRRPARRAHGAPRPAPVRGLFVTGTDTGVGKSVLAASICAALAGSGEAVAAFKPVVTGIDEPRGRLAARPRAARRGGERGPGARRRRALPVRAAAVAAPRRRAGRRAIEPPLSSPSARARRPARAAGLRGVGGLLGAAHARVPRARPRGRPRAAGGGRRPDRARDDQPHAADRRGRARGRAARGRRRDDPVAGAPRADRAVEPGDGRASAGCR